MTKRGIYEKYFYNGVFGFLPWQFAPVIWVLLTFVAFGLILGGVSLLNGNLESGVGLVLFGLVSAAIVLMLRKRSPHLFTDKVPPG